MGMSIEEFRKMQNAKPKAQNDMQGYRAYTSNEKGRSFEEDILRACEWYRRNGIAVINKVNEPYRVIKKLEGGRFIGQHTAAAEPDFKGVLKGGRGIAFEAKYTSKSRIQRSVVTQEQMDWLQEQYDMGAIAFVCICIKDRYFSVPWIVWRDMKQIYGKKYLMPGDISQFEVAYRHGVMFAEYRSLPFERLLELYEGENRK